MLEKGKDVIFTPIDQYLEMKCPTCGETMDSQRGILGCTSFAEAVGRSKHFHDKFVCKHAEADWHTQVKMLQECAKKTPSSKLASIYTEESLEVLKTRVSSKECIAIS